MSRAQLEALLGESSTALNNLRAARNQSIPSALATREDRNGRTFKDDLRENVLLPEAETHLQSLEAAVAGDLRAGDLPGAQVNLVSLRRELALEIERFKAITDYWKEASSIKPRPLDRETPARINALRASGIEPPAADLEAAALETQFHAQIASREFAPAMNTIWPKLLDAYKLAKLQEAQLILSRLERGELQDLASALPTRKCIPAKETSHTNFPTIQQQGFPPTNNYYTEKMAAAGLEGSPEVFIVVDSRGCPERTVVIISTGNPVLDIAAARMTADAYYRPAENDGVAVRSAFSMRIEWNPRYPKRR
jgi:TonB family protein